jgi:SEC-C motif
VVVKLAKKIGRNDPCPCGSGKKYKLCCYGKVGTTNRTTLKSEEPHIEPQISRLAIMRHEQKLQGNQEELVRISNEFEKYYPDKSVSFEDFILSSWNQNKLRKMSTLEIVEKLKSMNVDFDVEHFKKQVVNYISASQLAEDHYYSQNFQAQGKDEDFIWLAIIELWNRITPEKYNMEMIDDLMQEGYEYIEKRDYRNGIEKWENAWNVIKSIVPSNIKSVSEADKFIPVLTQFINNWCQDFEMELANAAVEDNSYYVNRIRYCQDFLRIFPNSDKSIIKNMLKAVNESHDLFSFEYPAACCGDENSPVNRCNY